MKLALVFITMSTLNTLNAQNKTVLINGVATKVNVSNTQLVAIYDSLNSYMDGYEAAPSDPFKKVRPRLQSEIAAAPVASASPETSNVKYVDVDKEMNFDNGLFFEPNSAVLTKKAENAVKKYVNTLKSGKAKTVLLKSWHLSDNKASKELVKDRLEACKKVFISNGIGTNVILTSLTASNEESKFVTIVLK